MTQGCVKNVHLYDCVHFMNDFVTSIPYCFFKFANKTNELHIYKKEPTT